MRDRIVHESINSLREEGLRFSVDTLATRLKISKKTVYKYFPDKETLAFAIFEAYYAEVNRRVQALIGSPTASTKKELLSLYYDAKVMTRPDIFNKYALNEALGAYVAEHNHTLREKILAALPKDGMPYDGTPYNGTPSLGASSDTEALGIIIDGAFEKLCQMNHAPEAVIEGLVKLL